MLLRAFLEEFKADEKVCLLLKVWSTNGYDAPAIRAQAADFARRELGHDLLADSRIRFIEERLPQAGLLALYRAADAFVLPSRGEGWGRPYMEAMATGLPTIGTKWSGNTAFMTADNSYLLDCRVVSVPEVGWRELPTYRGHRWAEPDGAQLRHLIRRVVTERGEAAAVGQRAREEVLAQCSREAVGKLLVAELERVREAHAHPQRLGQFTKVTAETLALTGLVNGDGTAAPPETIEPSLLSLPSRVQAQQHERLRQQQRERLASRQPQRIGPTQAEPPDQAEPLAVRWEGALFSWHSLAYVNREFCLGLLERGVELALVPTQSNHFDPAGEPRFGALLPHLFAPLAQPAVIHVRHFFPPRFEAPTEGHLVLIQPWEYGYLPARWIEPIQAHVSEVWCYSEYVKAVYRASGIAEARLQVVPLGVDTKVFTPDAPPYVFTTEPGAARWQAQQARADGDAVTAPFTFLFVGGTLHRKGIDILLEAYQKAFTSLDEVCLVIKDTGTETVYRGQNAREQILGIVGDPKAPPIVYLEEELSSHQLVGLYATCDCLVQPYRGEGFCLPALEAMACGLPTIVLAGGPTDDFVDETVGWRVAAAHKPFGDGRIGEWDCVGATWMFEVGVDDLARLLRRVVQQRDEARHRGAAALKRVRESWTWEQACDKALARLHALHQTPLPPGQGLAPPRLQSLPPQVTQPSPGASNGTSAPQPAPPSLTASSAPVQQPQTINEVAPRLARAGTTAARIVPSAIRAARPEPSSINGSQGQPPVTATGRAQPTISLYMIVRNEERVLDACLESVKPWVDETILVDTGSTDRTVEIATFHGAQVFHLPWPDSFSIARNESLDHATGDWLFWMDADDTLPEACGRQLREVVMLAEERTTGFLLQVHIPPAPGDNGFTIVDHVKLFRNWPQLRFEGRIHEQILEPIYRVGGRIERTDLYVVHSGYDYSPEGQQRKRERDFSLLAKDLEDRPDHPFVLFNIGMTAYHLKDFDKALPALERCLALSQPHESTVRKVYAMLAGCHLEKRNLEQAVAIVEQGLKRFPHDPELLFRAGIIYREVGNLQAAEQSYLKLLTARGRAYRQPGRVHDRLQGAS